METNFKSYLPPGSPEQHGFAGTPLTYPGRLEAGFMQTAPEPMCIKKAADGTCRLNVYQAALFAGIALAIGLAATGGPDSSEPSISDETYLSY